MRTHPGSVASLLRSLIASSAVVLSAACSNDTTPSPLPPSPDAPTANAYILPNAADLGANAFGDHPVVVRRGERLRWRNADTVQHNVTTETESFPEFRTTGVLAPGRDASFVMRTPGTARIRCTIHPSMTGSLVVED